ncbi:MAG: hypothetical protein BWY94_02251 [Actinobacteria bacterium ADurb.BinA094]|nr:MAG: hypothetical protein BWY94_02251 [Actinobacteria bacterium ADurb.BinA094]
MQIALPQTVEVRRPRVHEGHAADAERPGVDVVEDRVPQVTGARPVAALLRRDATPPGGHDGYAAPRRPARRDVGGLLRGRDGRTHLRRAAAARLPRRAQRRQRTVVLAQVLAAERAQGMFAVPWSEILEPHATVALLRQCPHRVGKGHTCGPHVSRRRVASQQSHGLQVDAPYRRCMLECELQNGAETVEVDAAHDGRHEHHAESGLGAAEHGLLFEGGQRASPQRLVRRVVDPVELQEHRTETGRGQGVRVPVLAGEPQPVRVELDEAVTEVAPKSDDLGQVVAHRRLAPRELHVAAGGDLEQTSIPPLDRRERRVCRLTARRCEAHRAHQVAAPGHLQQDAARLTEVGGAQSALRGACRARRGRRARRSGAGGGPVGERRRAAPDQGLRLTVLGTDAPQPDLVAAPDQVAVHASQTLRTERRGADGRHASPHPGRSPCAPRSSRAVT